MKCRLLCSGCCKLGSECDSAHNDSFPDTVPRIRRSGRGRYQSWLDSRRLHPDGPLNKQRVRTPDSIEAIYRVPWASCPPVIADSRERSCSWRRMRGNPWIFVQAFPQFRQINCCTIIHTGTSGGLSRWNLVSGLSVQLVTSGEWRTPSLSSRHQPLPSISSVIQAHWGSHWSKCFTSNWKKEEKRPCFTHWMCGFFVGSKPEIGYLIHRAITKKREVHLKMRCHQRVSLLWLRLPTFKRDLMRNGSHSYRQFHSALFSIISVAHLGVSVEPLKVARLPSDSSSTISQVILDTGETIPSVLVLKNKSIMTWFPREHNNLKCCLFCLF